MRKKSLLTWLGVAISAALVYWIATKFDLVEAAQAIRRAEPIWLVAGGAVYLALFVLRGFRWAVLLKPIKKVSGWTATEVFIVGFLANNMLPARLGDVARAYVLARREGIAAAASFSSVMLERIFDGVMVVAFLNLVLWLDPPEAAWVGPFGLIMGALFVGAISVCALLVWNERRMVALIGKILFFVPGRFMDKIYGLVGRLSEGLHTLKSAARTLEVIGLSLLLWTLETSVYVLIGRAYGLDIPFLGMMLVMCILTLGLTAPSAPGFVGVFEGLIIKAIGLYGVVGPQAVAYAITVHLVHYVPGTLLGLVFSWRSGLKLGELRQAAES